MKKTDSPVPHDGLFKTFLGHTDTARDFLKIYLPPELRKICCLNTLQLESGSFIEEDLRTYALVFENHNGRGLYLHAA